MFASIKGHENTTATLTRLLTKGRLPHFTILSGADGDLLLSVAREMAAFLVCDSEKCTTQVLNGHHQDVILLEKDEGKTEFTVDKVRFLSGDMAILPASGRHKVYLLKDAHLLNMQGQNALLKNLEEPPKHVYFILMCKEAGLLLPTIRSRGVCFSFSQAGGQPQGGFLAQLTQHNAPLQQALLEQEEAGLAFVQNMAAACLAKRKDILLAHLHKLYKQKDKERIKQTVLLVQQVVHLCLLEKITPTNALPEVLETAAAQVGTKGLIKLYERLEEMGESLQIHLNPNIAAVYFTAFLIE